MVTITLLFSATNARPFSGCASWLRSLHSQTNNRWPGFEKQCSPGFFFTRKLWRFPCLFFLDLPSVPHSVIKQLHSPRCLSKSGRFWRSCNRRTKCLIFFHGHERREQHHLERSQDAKSASLERHWRDQHRAVDHIDHSVRDLDVTPQRALGVLASTTTSALTYLPCRWPQEPRLERRACQCPRSRSASSGAHEGPHGAKAGYGRYAAWFLFAEAHT